MFVPDKDKLRKKESKGYHIFLTKEQTRVLWSWMLSHLHVSSSPAYSACTVSALGSYCILVLCTCLYMA